MTKTFEERVAKLGLGDPAHWLCEEIDALIIVEDIDGLKNALDLGLDKTAREAHVKALFEGVTQGSDTESALLRRVHEFIFGNAELSADDRKLVESAFPLELGVIAAPDKTINSQWHLGRSTSPQVVNVGTLTIEQGGYITIENTLLTFNVETIIRNGNTGSDNGDFNILGVAGGPGGTGTTPNAPGQAQNGNPGNCSSAGIAGSPGGNGWTGATGTIGGTGGKGSDGLPSMPATININKGVQLGPNVSQIIIKTMSGAGGAGGAGGTGTKGGKGGNGGNGVTCGCTGNAGGTGGQGGTGGPGGPGGPGGNAVDAAGNVVVNVPAAFYKLIVPVPITAQPGPGGPPGAGGSGGDGGGGSSGGKHNSGGSGGGSGSPGSEGTRGSDGTRTGKPAEVNVQPK
jgi:hypothetical protein